MSLVLDSLEIKNFRAFKHLRIEKLGRVNLIVGKNNVGKSSVLDALTLYACKGDPYMIFALLQERNEITQGDTGNKTPRRSSVDALERASSLRFLFHGRPNLSDRTEPIHIGSLHLTNDKVVLSVLSAFSRDYVDTSEASQLPSLADITGNRVPRINVKVANDPAFQFPLDDDYRSGIIRFRPEVTKVHYVPVMADGLDLDEMATLWDNIVLSDLEEDVLASLQVIAPEIGAVNMVGNEGPNGERITKVRTAGVDGPIPLRSMGEGMNRMFGIALALVNAKDGMLLIDEVDTGLHYSVLPELWRLIFEVAHRLNVQVFATSHSWDCIQAFQQAAEDDTEEEGILIRLEHRDGDVYPVMFDERKLGIAAREMIEVR